MALFKNIVVPTDFSEYSYLALEYAVGMAEKFSSTIRLVHVMEPLLQPGDVSWAPVDYRHISEEHKNEAREHLKKLVSDRIPESVATHVSILTGKAFVEILKYAREIDADLIVMATHGRGVIAQILMGSTAERVVRKAPCPVMTVRHPDHVFSMP
jgi:nucleotide-binding universal stress UspA family protein